jgi:hypothetical protein
MARPGFSDNEETRPTWTSTVLYTLLGKRTRMKNMDGIKGNWEGKHCKIN